MPYNINRPAIHQPNDPAFSRQLRVLLPTLAPHSCQECIHEIPDHFGTAKRERLVSSLAAFHTQRL